MLVRNLTFDALIMEVRAEYPQDLAAIPHVNFAASGRAFDRGF
ncbi:hypothetical protein [Chamaesiphon sp. VAR_48_metabat_403]|nr:hypothetical protein [Chamaesiphon sp. VAR_48_metabat_403]